MIPTMRTKKQKGDTMVIPKMPRCLNSVPLSVKIRKLSLRISLQSLAEADFDEELKMLLCRVAMNSMI